MDTEGEMNKIQMTAMQMELMMKMFQELTTKKNSGSSQEDLFTDGAESFGVEDDLLRAWKSILPMPAVELDNDEGTDEALTVPRRPKARTKEKA